jgi:N-acetylmuramic acid 6-phosphate etherase
VQYAISERDIVVGVAASGTTPYVIGALQESRSKDIPTGCIVCNPGSPVAAEADYPVEVVVGPEFVTGSTRMKSGTAQKLVLNMLSTAVMIRIGRVEGNKMVNMQLTNSKLVDRGTRMLMDNTGLTDYERARELLLKSGSVKKAIDAAGI